MNYIGKVVKVSYDKMVFEISDFGKMLFNQDGQAHMVKGINDYVVVNQDIENKFLYQVIGIEDQEKTLSNGENARFEYVAKIECIPVCVIESGKAGFNFSEYPFLRKKVYLASNEDVSVALSSSSEHQHKIKLGKAFKKVPVNLGADQLLTRHSAVIGNTGSGKSNTVRRILHEVSKLDPKNLEIHVFDVHNEYGKLPKGQYINVPNDFKIPIKELEEQDWINLLKPSDLVQLPILRQALKIANCLDNGHIKDEAFSCYLAYTLYNSKSGEAAAKRQKIMGLLSGIEIKNKDLYNPQYGNFSSVRDEEEFLDDLVSKFNLQGTKSHGENYKEYTKHLDKRLDEAKCSIVSFEKLRGGFDYALLLEEAHGNGQARSHVGTLKTRIDDFSRIYNKLFKSEEHSEKSSDSGSSNFIKVYDVSQMTDDLLLFFSSYVLKKEFNKNIEIRRNKQTTDIPVKIFIFEEAHRYISREKEESFMRETEIFNKIAREGRKFGCFLMLSSQRPSELAATVLSQCNNFLMHRVKNNIDLDYMLKSVPYIDKQKLTRLSFLPTGTAYIIGDLFEMPVEVAVEYMKDLDDSQSPSINFGKMLAL